MEEVRKCVVCGKEYIATHPSKNVCSEECRVERRKFTMKEYNKVRPKKPYKRKGEPTVDERIAHQQDITIWTRDYAERQKAQTLSMVQGITLYAGDTYSAEVSDEAN